MSRPLVSVIVGVYNKERFVGECLRSVRAQTYAPFELIVVDDASTDRSADVIQGLGDPRIRFVQRKTNSGLPAVPRNEGLRLARGDYVAFLDADDLWMPEKLDKQVAYLESHSGVALVHAACRVVDGAGRFLRVRHEGRLPPTGDYLLPLLEHCWISISSVLVKKEWADRIGAFDEDPVLRAREDYEWLLRAAAAGPIGVLEECLAAYRSSEDGISHGAGNWKAAPRDFLSHRDAVRHADRWGGRVSMERLVGIAVRAAAENAHARRRNGEFGKAAWFAWQMIRLDPWATAGWRQLAAAGLRRNR